MVSYDRLWETMKKKNTSQYRLIKYYGVSAGQIGRLKKNMYVSTHTIDMLCNILQCSVEDVMEIRLDDPQKSERKK
ncbi:MAG TPA: helix-turn-helix transcriptional regulator [Candidatus Lachnoclostridium stercoravium]|uniref:Helix-turn-helix transcriptional regulator n=1 Tax=Candidatus Lachnoclostridium stercoravium TaxID=2838633 RepID=A0A9D2KM60_9FIRM|nr:helix-turn-helix transcriptional regulator [Candidatus Lachnoclostridium stercoravium]